MGVDTNGKSRARGLSAIVIGAAIVTCTVAVGGGKVTGSSYTPPPVCTDGCIFLSTADYAQNLIRHSITHDDELLEKLSKQAVHRSPGWSDIYNKRAWWLQAIAIEDIKQDFVLEAPKLLSTSEIQKFREPITYSNCGSIEQVRQRSKTDLAEAERKTEDEFTIDKSSGTNTSVTVKGNYANVLSGSATHNITESVRETQRRLSVERSRTQSTVTETGPIVLPPFSVVSHTTTRTSMEEIYEVRGTVTTDAQLFIKARIKTVLGRLTDYLPKEMRSMPVVSTTKVAYVTTNLDVSPVLYENAEECRKHIP